MGLWEQEALGVCSACTSPALAPGETDRSWGYSGIIKTQVLDQKAMESDTNYALEEQESQARPHDAEFPLWDGERGGSEVGGCPAVLATPRVVHVWRLPWGLSLAVCPILESGMNENPESSQPYFSHLVCRLPLLSP